MHRLTLKIDGARPIERRLTDAGLMRLLRLLGCPALGTRAEVEAWHLGLVLEETATMQEAAKTLGISNKTLIGSRRRYGYPVDEARIPGGLAKKTTRP